MNLICRDYTDFVEPASGGTRKMASGGNGRTIVMTSGTNLGLIGVIVDPTTAGPSDSDRARGYHEPWEDK